MPKFVIISFLILICNLASARIEIKTDTNQIQLRAFSKQKIETFKKDRSFDYLTEPVVPVTLWDKIIQWIYRQIMKLFSNDGIAPYIRYAIFAVFIFVIILQIYRKNFSLIFYKSAKQKNFEYSGNEQTIIGRNFDNEISVALSSQNFRLATRLYYLKMLRKLSDTAIIIWQQNKTNYDYYRELQKTSYKESFARLTFLYEYVWYGQFAIEQNTFNNLQNEFETFFNNINI